MSKALSLVATLIVASSTLADICPYGVCAHLHRDEYRWYAKIIALAGTAGIRLIRCDLQWNVCQPRSDDSLDFSRFDEILVEAEHQGVQLAPILSCPPAWANPLTEHLDEWLSFVRAAVSRYRGRVPSWEVLNEVNCQIGGIGAFDAYARLLKATFGEIRKTDPKALVVIAGTAGIDMPWTEGVLKAGASGAFDVFAIHPYTRPFPPEGLKNRLQALRKLLAQYGAGKVPIWINEMGWPTQKPGFGAHAAAILKCALKATYPGRAKWRIAYADNVVDGVPANAALAESIQSILPFGSMVEAVGPGPLARRLAAGEFDLVMMPLGEEYVPRLVPVLAEFVKNGGVLVETGGMPFYHAREHDGKGAGAKIETDVEADRRALRIHDAAWWIDADYPRNVRCYPTDYARSLRFECDPAGYGSRLFISPKYLKPGDEFCSLLEGKTISGKSAVLAAVVKFGSDWKGYEVLSALDCGNTAFVGDAERLQALFHARALGLAFACGVGLYAPYELRGGEEVPYYSEAHYGLIHWSWAPKPAWSAYLAFVDRRPEGSVQEKSIPWIGKDGKTYCPRWIRPDGRKAGMLWTTGDSFVRELSVSAEKAEFHDFLGGKVFPLQTGNGRYRITVTEEPIYFTELR